MSWDFAEANMFSGVTASYSNALDWAVSVYEVISSQGQQAHVTRGDATSTSLPSESVDAVVTDPPYYDSVSYSNLADAFYIWLKRTLIDQYPQHFASVLCPKKREAIAATYRHGGDKQKASAAYEELMAAALREAHRVLKPGGTVAVVYAHKTTLGWATLVDAMRASGFAIVEAWPLSTEMRGGRKKVGRAMLASSIFLIARKRNSSPKAGNYESDVIPELASIVRERVETLWEMGISGADLVIACVGAGLRAFTRFVRVEYGNGEEVVSERFLAEVETVVVETILGKLSKTVGTQNGHTSLAGLDPATRFYVLWRYTYGLAELDAGEAIIFANGTHVELEGQNGLSHGRRALLQKKKSKYRLSDYTERGDEDTLGHPNEDGTAAPAVDALHRLLWLLEYKPIKIPDFLSEAKPNIEQLRLVAQALAGPALSGGELSDVSSTAEQSALGKLLANWSVVMVGKAALEDRRTGQESLFKS
jgi:putative DNA methylase